MTNTVPVDSPQVLGERKKSDPQTALGVSPRASRRTDLFEVIVIDDVSKSATVETRLSRGRKRRGGVGLHYATPWRLWIGGALSTIAIHLLVLSPLVTGGVKRKLLPPMTEGMITNQHATEAGEFVSAYFVVNDNSINAEQPDDSIYEVPDQSNTPLQKNRLSFSLKKIAQPALNGAEDAMDLTASSEDASGDGGEIVKLFGRYMDQVKARIERAWQYPAAAARNSFQCKVQIRQSKDGDVREVTLQHCDTDPNWQVSLVKAIEAASPLSAPPSERVFSEVLALSFSAEHHVQPADNAAPHLPTGVAGPPHDVRAASTHSAPLNPSVETLRLQTLAIPESDSGFVTPSSAEVSSY